MGSGAHLQLPSSHVSLRTTRILTDKAWTMICSGEAGAAEEVAVSVMVGLVVSVKGSPWLEPVWSK